MENKQILFVEKGKAELVDRPMPVLGHGEVLVETYVTSVSPGTERANLAGEVNVSREIGDGQAHFPRSAGYSASGVVRAVGEGVTDYRPGDRVAMSWSVHARYNKVGLHNLAHIPENVSFEAAALCHIACFPLAAIRKCGLEMGESAAVMGLGVLGMLAVSLLRAGGAYPIIAVDPIPAKREEALRRGADYALDPFAPDFAAEARRLSGGGVRVGIEVTGVGAGLNGILDCMAPMGRVALLGCTRSSDFTVDYYHKVHGPGISLIGAHTLARPEKESSRGLWTTKDDMAALLRLLAGKRLDFDAFVAETHAPEEAPEVYTRLLTEKGFPLVQFDWREK